MPEEDAFHLESRHLGLMLPEKIGNLGKQIDRAAEILTETLDMESVLKIAWEAKEMEYHPVKEKQEAAGRKVRIGVARDLAFCFYYKDNMELLKELGCEIIPFSPLEDTRLPEHLDGLLFGGGYPELWAKHLAENRAMRKWNSMYCGMWRISIFDRRAGRGRWKALSDGGGTSGKRDQKRATYQIRIH